MDLNNLVEEKDVKDLQKEEKKFKFSLKRTLLGIFSVLLLWSTKPNIEYAITKLEADNNSYIARILNDTSLSREEQISQIYQTALMENHKISEDLKKRLMDAFTTEVIAYAGCFFTDEIIKNMYAVVKTEDIREMYKFEKEYGWWDGNYISFSNSISIDSMYADKTLLAHEQMHAILKDGLFGSGLIHGIHGYGINEGATVSFVKSDHSYSFQNRTFDLLGLVLGYKDIFQTYTNSNLSELMQILSQYIPPQEAKELILLLDRDVFRRICTNIYGKKSNSI